MNPCALPPLILDFDASVLPFCLDEARIPLADWQERIRFGCSKKSYEHMEEHLAPLLPESHGCVFTGSGDFHHLSLFLLRRLARVRKLRPQSIDLVVCDNHPDNMRYPFGIHCGSWVYHACGLDVVRQVHVVGITSNDISLKHAWENYLSPFFRRKLSYWSIGSDASWLAWLGRGDSARRFDTADALVEAFIPALEASRSVYISLDKDVFSPDVVRTNWDQGLFMRKHVEGIALACGKKLAGCDITGEVSEYSYKSRFKAFLSGLDGQKALPAGELALWQKEQQACNKWLLELLGQH